LSQTITFHMKTTTGSASSGRMIAVYQRPCSAMISAQKELDGSKCKWEYRAAPIFAEHISFDFICFFGFVLPNFNFILQVSSELDSKNFLKLSHLFD
jgi:hypothetical protein